MSDSSSEPEEPVDASFLPDSVRSQVMCAALKSKMNQSIPKDADLFSRSVRSSIKTKFSPTQQMIETNQSAPPTDRPEDAHAQAMLAVHTAFVTAQCYLSDMLCFKATLDPALCETVSESLLTAWNANKQCHTFALVASPSFHHSCKGYADYRATLAGRQHRRQEQLGCTTVFPASAAKRFIAAGFEFLQKEVHRLVEKALPSLKDKLCIVHSHHLRQFDQHAVFDYHQDVHHPELLISAIVLLAGAPSTCLVAGAKKVFRYTQPGDMMILQSRMWHATGEVRNDTEKIAYFFALKKGTSEEVDFVDDGLPSDAELLAQPTQPTLTKSEGKRPIAMNSYEKAPKK